LLKWNLKVQRVGLFSRSLAAKAPEKWCLEDDPGRQWQIGGLGPGHLGFGSGILNKNP